MPSPFDLTAKAAVITGSSRGIGRSIAETMAELGAKVVVSSRKAEACEEVAAGMARVGTTVPEKNGVADAIAARGRRLASLGPGGDVTGLSRPAERLRSEATEEAERLRSEAGEEAERLRAEATEEAERARDEGGAGGGRPWPEAGRQGRRTRERAGG